MNNILDWGIGIVLWFQQFSPGLDSLFKAFTFTGEEDFFFLLLPIVAWCIDRRKGLRLAIVFLVSGFIGTVIKEITNLPRPYQYDLRVQMLFETEGKAFPSLHTQNAVVIWGFLAHQFKKKWLWIVALVLVIGVPLSRVYLGLHFPTDLLGGYVFGVILLVVFLRYESILENQFHNLAFSWKLAIACMLPMVIFLISPKADDTVSSTTGVVFGAWIGIILERKYIRYSAGGVEWKRVVRFVIGIAGVMLIRVGLSALFANLSPVSLFRYIRYAIIGFWFTMIAPWLFMRFSLVEKETAT